MTRRLLAAVTLAVAMLAVAMLAVTMLAVAVLAPACARAPETPKASPPAPAKQTIPPNQEKTEVTSMIFVKKNTDGTGDGFQKLINLMEKNGVRFYQTAARSGLIAKDDVVILKSNAQWDQRGQTNTDLLKSIITAITAHPEGFSGEVLICDNGQGQFGARGSGGTMDWDQNNAKDKAQSARKVADELARAHKVSAVSWDAFTRTAVQEYSSGDMKDGFVVAAQKSVTGAAVSYAKFRSKYGTYISFKNGVWDDKAKKFDSERLKVINVPVLKAHSTYQVTACVKSYMGTTSDILTNHDSHTAIGRGFMGTQMTGTRFPVLNVLDAIWINPVRGPSTPYASAVEKRMVIAGLDPVAMDYWAAKNVLMPAAKEAGNRNYGVMDPSGKEPGTFGYWLRLSMNELKAAGHAVTMDESQIKVFTED